MKPSSIKFLQLKQLNLSFHMLNLITSNQKAFSPRTSEIMSIDTLSSDTMLLLDHILKPKLTLLLGIKNNQFLLIAFHNQNAVASFYLHLQYIKVIFFFWKIAPCPLKISTFCFVFQIAVLSIRFEVGRDNLKAVSTFYLFIFS